MQNFSKTKTYAFGGIFFLIFLGIHFFPGKISMFNYWDWNEFPDAGVPSNKYIQSVIDYHREFPSFARRWFTNFYFNLFPQKIIGYVFIFSEWMAMVALGFFWIKRNGSHLLPILLFFLSFPILFAWFPSQYTFEEPFLLLFLFGFISYLPKHQLSSMAFALLALLTRETAIFIILPWLWLEKRLSIPWGIIMVLGFIPFWGLSQNFGSELKARWEELLHYNFQNQTFAIETILYFFFTFFPTLLFLPGQKKEDRNAFLILLLFNTLLIFCGAKARESRLHLLPLFFILMRWQPIKFSKFHRKSILLAILGMILAGFFFYSGFWSPSGALVETVWVREYGILWGGLFGLTAGMLIFEKSTELR